MNNSDMFSRVAPVYGEEKKWPITHIGENVRVS